MGDFDADAMASNLEELFADTFVSVEQEGDEVRVSTAELGPRKCRSHIEDSFDGSGGIVSGLIDKAIGADVVVYEDFDIDKDGDELIVSEK